MRILLTIICCCCFLFATAQDESATKDILKEKKYYNSMGFGFNIGGSGETFYRGGVGFRYSAGYVLNQYLSFGLGTGFEFYDFEFPTAFIPVYAEIRGEVTQWKVRPFYEVEIGAGFKMPSQYSFGNDKQHGVYFRPQIGWKFKSKGDFASTIGAGYQLQTAVQKNDYSWGEDVWIEKTTRKYQRYFVQFGFEF